MNSPVKSNPPILLKLVHEPGVGHVLHAPPVLIPISNTTDYTCGECGIVLLRAEQGQVHNLLIHCTGCGSYNSTNA
jgi:hypothetical protein